jgi:hypothetical protein
MINWNGGSIFKYITYMTTYYWIFLIMQLDFHTIALIEKFIMTLKIKA